MGSYLFTPEKFFNQLNHYSSQGRGLFRLKKLPDCFYNGSTIDETKVNKSVVEEGKKILESGIAAQSFSIPNSTLATISPYSYIGPTVQIPYTQQFGNLDVTFLLIGKNLLQAQSLYYTLTKWQELIAGPRPHISDSSDFVQSNRTMFAVEYYDNYVSEAKVQVFSPTVGGDALDEIKTKRTIEIHYTELYPISIQAMALSWDSPDTPLSLSVSFAFHYAHPIIPSDNNVMMPTL